MIIIPSFAQIEKYTETIYTGCDSVGTGAYDFYCNGEEATIANVRCNEPNCIGTCRVASNPTCTPSVCTDTRGDVCDTYVTFKTFFGKLS